MNGIEKNCFNDIITCEGCYWLSGSGCEYKAKILKNLIKALKKELVWYIKHKLRLFRKRINRIIIKWLEGIGGKY